MKMLNTVKGDIGPFDTIEVLEDRYRCDGVDYPFNVFGPADIADFVHQQELMKSDAIPDIVPMVKARLALLQMGLLSAVNAQVDSWGDEAKIIWDYSVEVHKDHALVASMQAALGWADDDVNHLFRLASTL